jgi:hypothetical protein
MREIESRYQTKLNEMPSPGRGRHKALLGIANLGIMAHLPPERIHADIAARTASAPMPDREIEAAIVKAARDHQAGGTPPAKPAPIVKDGNAGLRRIIDQGRITDDADLWEASPYRLTGRVEDDPLVLLENLFGPHNYIFIGGKFDDGILGQTIRRVSEWGEYLRAGGTAGPYVIINDLTGKPAPKKSGGDSYRGDAAIASYRHCLIEFDDLPREDQLRFWSAARLPIRALVDTGGKSIHAWIDLTKLGEVKTQDDWDRVIKVGLYERVLIPLGVDRACCNPARLSRLPGCRRGERMQRLLWFSPEGREVLR